MSGTFPCICGQCCDWFESILIYHTQISLGYAGESYCHLQKIRWVPRAKLNASPGQYCRGQLARTCLHKTGNLFHWNLLQITVAKTYKGPWKGGVLFSPCCSFPTSRIMSGVFYVTISCFKVQLHSLG